MSWQVDFETELRKVIDCHDFSDTFKFQIVDHLSNQLENESCQTLGAKHIAAPVRCSIWIFNLPDEHEDFWRFRVTFNETAVAGKRTIYEIIYRKLETS